MARKLTLETKRLLSNEVTGETKRCLAILKRIYHSGDIFEMVKDDLLNKLHQKAIKEMIEGSPYIEFHPELLKRIPK